jgi:SAM-dependent methyltransferase
LKFLSKHQTRRRLLRKLPDFEDLQEMCAQWFDTPLGAQALITEQKLVSRYLSRLFGYHILQMGCSPQHSLITDSPVGHKIIFSPNPAASGGMAVADNEELPLAGDSIDVVLIHHALDFSPDSHKLLREAARVLRPGGQLLILGFNPTSLWGISKLLRVRSQPPWNGRFISSKRVSDWLNLLELHVEQVDSCLHFMPSKWGKVLQSAAKTEELGSKFRNPFGGAYLIQATKQVLPLTPITPKWRPIRTRATALPAAENIRAKNLH